MLSRNELRYTLALQRVPNLGDTSAKKLIQSVGSVEGIFKEKKSNLLRIDGIGSFKIKELDSSYLLDAAEDEIRYLEANKISYSFYRDKDYPDRLKHCIDGPILFFHRGNLDLKEQRIISIVGTRQATLHGIDFCKRLIEDLAPIKPIIVSGFAYGVDIVAHRSAVENGLQTIACLAHGFNEMYPKSHKKYVSEIEDNGGFISEFWSSDNFERTNFLKRNRIIAGLSEATIVIESAEKGGSLVTADIANSYNREVFAVPGRPSDHFSRGCNMLIKSEQARLLSCAADLVYMLGWDLQLSKPRQTKLFVELSSDEKVIQSYLKQKDKELLDIIAIECQLPISKVATLLLNMELKGVIRPLPGKLFQLVS